MSKSRRLRALGTAAAPGLLVVGILLAACGDDAPQPSIPASDRIELKESPDAKAPSEPEPSAAEACLDFATREDWGRALDPCTRAAREHPDDPEIQQALERALGAEDAEIE